MDNIIMINDNIIIAIDIDYSYNSEMSVSVKITTSTTIISVPANGLLLTSADLAGDHWLSHYRSSNTNTNITCEIYQDVFTVTIEIHESMYNAHISHNIPLVGDNLAYFRELAKFGDFCATYQYGDSYVYDNDLAITITASVIY